MCCCVVILCNKGVCNKKCYPAWDSNPESSAPEADALSIGPTGPCAGHCALCQQKATAEILIAAWSSGRGSCWSKERANRASALLADSSTAIKQREVPRIRIRLGYRHTAHVPCCVAGSAPVLPACSGYITRTRAAFDQRCGTRRVTPRWAFPDRLIITYVVLYHSPLVTSGLFYLPS